MNGDPRAMGTVDSVRWWAGWHPLSTVVAGGGLLGFFLANAFVTQWLRFLGGTGATSNPVRDAITPTASLLALGVVVGFAVWLLGVREVNRRYRDGPGSFVDRHHSPVDPSHVIVERARGGQNGNAVLVGAPKRAHGVGFAFDADSVAVNDVSVGVPARQIHLDGGKRTIPYAQISTVESSDDALTVETDDGETLRFEAESVGGVEPIARALNDRIGSATGTAGGA